MIVMDTTHPVKAHESEQGGIKGTLTETKCITASGIPYCECKFVPTQFSFDGEGSPEIKSENAL